MRLTKGFVSPARLFVATWSFSLIAAYLGPKETVYQQYGVVRDTFTVEGMLWICAAILAFIAGVALANRKLLAIRSVVHPSKASNREKWESWKIQVGLIPSYIFAIGILILLIYWTILAIMKIGSLSLFATSLYQNWHSTGDLWIAQKPFVGARLAYTGLISVVVFASSGIAYIKHNNLKTDKTYNIWIFLIFIGILPLMILPLFISQRVLLATAITGSIISYIAVYSEGISLKFPILCGFLGFAVWTAQEVVRVGFTSGTIVDSVHYGINRLLLYFSNDIGNLNRGVAYITDHTYGFRSFNFVFRYLFIEDTIQSQYFGSFYSEIENYKAGGTFTALGEPYMDFGIFGLLLIFIWGYSAQLVYRRSEQSVFAAQVYGLFGASIVLSWHFAVLSNVYFWFNTFLLAIIMVVVPSVLSSLYHNLSKEDENYNIQ